MSSTSAPRFGKSSDTSSPLCPYRLNGNGLGISGPGYPWRTMTSPATLPSSGCPAYFISAGLGSNVSTWLTPPLMNSEITAVARGLKCGGLGAYGLKPTGAAWHAVASPARRRSWFSRYASASPLTPPPDRKRKSRRDQIVFVAFIVPAASNQPLSHKGTKKILYLSFSCSSCFRGGHPRCHSPGIDEFVHIHQHVRQTDQRLLLHGVHAQRQLGRRRRPRQRDAVREIDLGGRIVARLLAHAVGEHLRLVQDERIVEQRERLRRHRGHGPRARGDILLRQVEHLEHGKHQAAASIHVHAPSPDAGTIRL